MSQATPAEKDSFYAEVLRRLINSGEWNSIQALLADKLNESGWIDNVRHKATDSAKVMDFRELLIELSPNAQSSIPLAVRRDIQTLLRRFVEKQVET